MSIILSSQTETTLKILFVSHIKLKKSFQEWLTLSQFSLLLLTYFYNNNEIHKNELILTDLLACEFYSTVTQFQPFDLWMIHRV